MAGLCTATYGWAFASSLACAHHVTAAQGSIQPASVDSREPSLTFSPVHGRACLPQRQASVTHLVAGQRHLLARDAATLHCVAFRLLLFVLQLFLEPGQVAMGNQYGLQPCADDGSTPVLDCYDAVAAAAAAGQQGWTSPTRACAWTPTPSNVPRRWHAVTVIGFSC